LYWHVTRRRVRARNLLRAASVDLPFAYDLWLDRVERNHAKPAEVAAAVEQWEWQPSFSVLLYAEDSYSPKDFERSKNSVERQVYPVHSLDLGVRDPLTRRLTAPQGDYVVLLRVGDLLAPMALYRMAEALQVGRSLIVYGDQDEIDHAGRRKRPWFKPGWNEEMFLAQDFLCGATAIDAKLARQCAGEGSVAALLLTSTSHASGAITRIPHILCHASPTGQTLRAGERLNVVARHVERSGATCSPGPFDTVKVQWPLPEHPPLVTIIVPTRDKVELLQPCIEGVLERTDYPSFEVLIIDNDSVEKRTAEFLASIQKDQRVRVRAFHGPYNFSTMNNFAVSEARGAYVCLLNNDTEVLEPAWLTEMMRYAVRPEVGAVGAKLLYDDGTIQHAGVVIGLGEAAGHAHRLLPADDPGYFAMPHVAQYVSAVTAACLIVEKKKFESVDGLDPELAHAFNDVDLCLRLEAAGWRNVYVPHAVLVHHESKTRPKDQSPDQIDRFLCELRLLQDRWGTKTYNDPQHNPNLDRYSETFVLGF
jgi:GT2 family glycosyltransferase